MQFKISKDKCSGCGSCMDVCPTEAISFEHGKAEIGIECVDCGACPRVCPEGAIKMQRSPAAISRE